MTGPATGNPGPSPVVRLADRKTACSAGRRHQVTAPGHGSVRVLTAARHPDRDTTLTSRSGGAPASLSQSAGPDEARRARGRSGAWLVTAAGGLAVLAGAAATVSFSAQYQMVHAARGLPVIAALEAAIPDAAALIFASLGIALALHGRRAVRARLLNLASVGTSVAMNVLAAAPGWRDLAIWAMPPIAYALASDTLISVVRATAIARRRITTDDEATPLALIGGLVLWLVRLAMAPVSTLHGLRRWVLNECPIAPGRRSSALATGTVTPAAINAGPAQSLARSPRARAGTKTARFLALVTEQHGPLATIPLASVAKISAGIAPLAGLDTGAARTALRKAVLKTQERSQR